MFEAVPTGIRLPTASHRLRWLAHTTLVGLVGAMAVGVACVPSRLAQSDTNLQLQVTGSEFKFQMSNQRVPVGQKVTISFTNHGTIEHNFTSDIAGVHLVAQPGQTVSTTTSFPSAGDVYFVCTIPGHKEAGMQTKVAAAASSTGAAASSANQSAVAVAGVSTSAVTPVPPGTQRLPHGQIAPPIHRTDPALVKVSLEVQQVIGLVTDGVAYRYWTFGGSVPGPMVRVRQGDTVELTLVNPPGVEATHSINVHAAIGPGGGALQVAPGQQNTFRFQADHPGVWVYHCMTPIVGQHVSNGMFGMVVVEPPEGLPAVDREFYVMQDELYLQGTHGDPGLHELALDRLLAEQPDYVVYNGSVGSLTGENAMTARVGETVRFFFGVAGPNLDSAFHVVGLAWDKVHPEGAEEMLSEVQTTLVPPGGATMTELTLRVPGMYMLEDHHITRLEKGAFADLHVEGPDNPLLFQQNYHDPAPATTGASPFSISEEPLKAGAP